jgi:hypothetical protein
MDVTVSIATGNIAYMHGTVNGVDVEWRYLGYYLWNAVADISDDNKYHVKVRAYNMAGSYSEFEAVLTYGLDLIFTRTQADVARARYLMTQSFFNDMTTEERIEWTGRMIGFYNASDMNRVETAVRWLKEMLLDYGYTIAAVGIKTDWTVTDMPNEIDHTRYLGNVEAFRRYAPWLDYMPLPDEMRWLDIEGANNIERFLFMINVWIERMRNGFWYSGEVYSGEV